MTENEEQALNQIMQDIERDVADLDNKPFNGKSVGEMFGNVCAAIYALACIMKGRP